jgi:uncharacterized repeat protein (TIGR01451 family)
VLRTEIGLSQYAKAVAVADRSEARGQEQVRTRVPTLATRQTEATQAAGTKVNVSGNEVVARTDIIGRVAGGPQVVSDSVLTRDLMAVPTEAPRALERPLKLTKDVDKHSAQPGEVVTFTLKYTNHGGLPITDVAVVDSLSPRLEYIPGTAVSDRDAVFTMQQNEAGSLMLRWEIGGKLLPGESGVIRFQAKVR